MDGFTLLTPTSTSEGTPGWKSGLFHLRIFSSPARKQAWNVQQSRHRKHLRTRTSGILQPLRTVTKPPSRLEPAFSHLSGPERHPAPGPPFWQKGIKSGKSGPSGHPIVGNVAERVERDSGGFLTKSQKSLARLVSFRGFSNSGIPAEKCVDHCAQEVSTNSETGECQHDRYPGYSPRESLITDRK